MDWNIAQVNIARLKEPLDSPVLADFVAGLEPINELADQSPGFVWRLQTEDGDATALRVFDDDMLLINMSVWASIDALASFVYRSAHAGVMRRRREWFETMTDAYHALWWLPATELPSVEDAKARLMHLRRNGPTPYAFTFKNRFGAPDSDVSEPTQGEWFCPA